MVMFRESYRYIITRATDALDRIDENSVLQAVKIIKDARAIFVYGSGRSGLVGKFFAMRLVQLGLISYFVGETITPVVRREDAVVLISNTGKTKSTILVADIVRRIGAKVIVITSDPNSPLTRLADVVICIKPENNRKDLAPLGTLFEISSVIFLDSLISQLMMELGLSEEDMRRRHAIWV